MNMKILSPDKDVSDRFLNFNEIIPGLFLMDKATVLFLPRSPLRTKATRPLVQKITIEKQRSNTATPNKANEQRWERLWESKPKVFSWCRKWNNIFLQPLFGSLVRQHQEAHLLGPWGQLHEEKALVIVVHKAGLAMAKKYLDYKRY